ncbi:TonB family protein [Pyruvatibacter sp.]|uniref:energy transducer TonB n=1 Tax=Pyruvatibacter sp. TaxID=1981328 RepID=UPI00326404DC
MQFPDDIDREPETARPAGLETQTVRRSRSRVLMWSVLFHAIAIAALWAVLAGDPPQLKDEAPVIAVDLVALAQSAPAGSSGSPGPAQPDPPPTSQPVVPQPVKPAPPVVRQQERPAPKPRAEPKPEPESAPVSKAEDVPKAPAPSAPDPSPTPADAASSSPTQAPAPQRSSGAGSGTGQSDASSSAVAKASYARLLLTRLQRAIVYPRRARRRDIQGVVRVEVVLAASGALKTVKLVGTSGSDILDDAALELVRRVAPFPAVPRDLSPRGQDFAFVAPIQYRLN